VAMAELSEEICQYISTHWIKDKSNRAFAIENDIDEKTVRSIKSAKTTKYKISLITLEKFCINHNLELSEFFQKINR
jgi:ribosomal protein S26